MSKVIQIRDVPDDVYNVLTQFAAQRRMSLTKYLVGELGNLARQTQEVRHNAAVIRETQARVRGSADRDTILSALREARGE